MDCDEHDPARPLADIVANRPPWFRARLSTMHVWPTIHGGWLAILHYAHYTTAQPGETVPPGINVTYLHGTHHPLAFDGADPAAVWGKVRDLEQTGVVGRLTLNRVATQPSTPGGPPSPGWTILTHSGSDAERQVWQRRIGQAV